MYSVYSINVHDWVDILNSYSNIETQIFPNFKLQIRNAIGLRRFSNDYNKSK